MGQVIRLVGGACTGRQGLLPRPLAAQPVELDVRWDRSCACLALGVEAEDPLVLERGEGVAVQLEPLLADDEPPAAASAAKAEERAKEADDPAIAEPPPGGTGFNERPDVAPRAVEGGKHGRRRWWHGAWRRCWRRSRGRSTTEERRGAAVVCHRQLKHTLHKVVLGAARLQASLRERESQPVHWPVVYARFGEEDAEAA